MSERVANKHYYGLHRHQQGVLGLAQDLGDRISDPEEMDEEEVAFLVDEILREAGRMKSASQKFLATKGGA